MDKKNIKKNGNNNRSYVTAFNFSLNLSTNKGATGR